VYQHAEAVRMRDAEERRLPEQPGLRRIVDHVVHGGGAGQPGEINGRGIAFTQARAGGVDDKGAGREVGGNRGRDESVQRNSGRKGRQYPVQRGEVLAGAVHQPEGGAAPLQALHCGAPRGSTRADKHDGRTGELAAERLPDGRGQPVAIGIEALPPGVRVPKRVDRASGPRRSVDFGHAVEGDHLVRNGEIHAAKLLHVQQLEGPGQVVGRDVESKVPPVGKPRVRGGKLGERRVVHRRADRVPDGMPQYGERHAVAGPRLQIGEGQDRINGDHG
jgi:hypothetical protein